MSHSAGIRIKLKLTAVLWSDEPLPFAPEWHGFELYRHDRALKQKIVKMLRRKPKKWDRRKGRTQDIFELSGVSCSWY